MELLSEAFFQAVLRDSGSGGFVFTCRRNGELIGWSLGNAHRGMLLDKHIRLAYPQAHEQNLYVVS
ncbi:MAG: GNAT family N-acetyltransferase, partial [Rhodanobacter sp.]